ncbi:MAG: GHKL domain-containing protein [Defluviitaleaceae bacterium]|nr:GHKL domain-containing protein [Defluviitaleaceae bacterium]
MNLHVALYLMSNTLMMFVIWKYMGVFFETRKTPAGVMAASFLFYLAFTSLVFVVFNMPLASMLANLVAYFVISLNYEASMMKRISAVLCGYILMLTIDVLVNLFLGAPTSSILFDSAFTDNFGFVVVGILSYFLVLLLGNFKNIKTNNAASPVFWISTLPIPMSSIFMTIIVLSSPNLSQLTVIAAVAVVISVNLLTFYLYDTMSESHADKLKAVMLAHEKRYYYSQCQLMQDSEERMNIFKHDIKNHLSTLKNYARHHQSTDMVEYLDKLLGDVDKGETYSETGNIAFDSIINHKLQGAAKQGIYPRVNVAIPPALNIEAGDVVAILGNLLDNAISAAAKTEEKMLNLQINWGKGGLFISLENSFDGEIKERGYGIRNARSSAERYNGHIKITHRDNVFYAGVLLYAEGL